jgi:hypothetical protein
MTWLLIKMVTKVKLWCTSDFTNDQKYFFQMAQIILWNGVKSVRRSKETILKSNNTTFVSSCLFYGNQIFSLLFDLPL